MNGHQLWQRDLQHILGWSAVPARRSDILPINVWVGEEGAVLTAAVAGVTPDSLDISVQGESLTVRGRRQNPGFAATDEVTVHRRERPAGEFVRTVQLPFRVDAEKVVARYNEGFLQLTLPRAAADRPQRIAIKAA